MITIHSPRTTKQKHAQIKRGINRLKKGLCKESTFDIIYGLADYVAGAGFNEDHDMKVVFEKPEYAFKSVAALLRVYGFKSIDELSEKVRKNADSNNGYLVLCIIGNCISSFEDNDNVPPNVMIRFSEKFLNDN